MLSIQAGHGHRFRSTRCFMRPGYTYRNRPGPVDSGNPYPLSPLSRHPWRSIPVELIPVTKQRPHSNGARCLCLYIFALLIFIEGEPFPDLLQHDHTESRPTVSLCVFSYQVRFCQPVVLSPNRCINTADSDFFSISANISSQPCSRSRCV